MGDGDSRKPKEEAEMPDAEMIERLMAQPVPKRPSIIVIGDDDIVGFTPAQPPPEANPGR